MTQLIIYRNEANPVVIATVNIDDKTIYTQKVMEAETIETHFYVPAAIPIQIGDFVVLNTKKYFLNQVPSVTKVNERSIKYRAFFHGVLYDLNNKLFISSDGLAEFSEVGTVSQFLTLIVEQLNTITNGWAIGIVESSGDLLLDFVNETCLEALNKVASSFKFEYELVGKTINFRKVIGTPRNLTFEYGKDKGLYGLERKQVDSKAVYTRVYGYGGTKNIPFDYRNRAKRLVFEERKLEQNTNIFGIREANFTDETIYPQRTAAISAVDVQFDAGKYIEDSWVEDTTIDFDINDYLLEGQRAKIVFKSGDLNGIEFEIWKADFDAKKIYFKAFQDTDGYVLPKEGKIPRVGDLYTLVDLKMPASYVLQAETDLKAATQAFLDTNCIPKTLYEVKIDPKFAKTNEIEIAAGDLVKIIDVTLGIDRAIRIQELKYPLVNKYKITALIADYIPYELQDFVNKTTTKNIKRVQGLYNRIANLTIAQKSIVYNTTYQNTNTAAASTTISVNNRVFTLIKAFDNTGTGLEVNDIITGNWWDRYNYIQAWQYKGGNKDLKDSWTQAEDIELIPTENEGDVTQVFEPIDEIYVNDRAFKIVKGYNNQNTQTLEVGDLIYGNWFNANIYVKAWLYLGGSTSLISSWQRLDDIDIS